MAHLVLQGFSAKSVANLLCGMVESLERDSKHDGAAFELLGEPARTFARAIDTLDCSARTGPSGRGDARAV